MSNNMHLLQVQVVYFVHRISNFSYFGPQYTGRSWPSQLSQNHPTCAHRCIFTHSYIYLYLHASASCTPLRRCPCPRNQRRYYSQSSCKINGKPRYMNSSLRGIIACSSARMANQDHYSGPNIVRCHPKGGNRSCLCQYHAVRITDIAVPRIGQGAKRQQHLSVNDHPRALGAHLQEKSVSRNWGPRWKMRYPPLWTPQRSLSNHSLHGFFCLFQA